MTNYEIYKKLVEYCNKLKHKIFNKKKMEKEINSIHQRLNIQLFIDNGIIKLQTNDSFTYNIFRNKIYKKLYLYEKKLDSLK